MRVIFGLVAAFFVVSLSQAALAGDTIVGHWYEDLKQHGIRTISIAHNKADGTYRAEFRACFKEGVRDTWQSGRWTYKGGKLYLTTDVVNGLPAHIEQVYQTTSLDSRIWDYRLISGALPQSFHDVRVTANSKMPGCDLSS